MTRQDIPSIKRRAMRGRQYDLANPSLGLQLLGDSWAMEVLTATLEGVDRYEALVRTLRIARNVLSDRLTKLTALGLLERQAYCGRPPRHCYRPTARALAFQPVIEAAKTWAREHNGGVAAFDDR